MTRARALLAGRQMPVSYAELVSQHLRLVCIATTLASLALSAALLGHPVIAALISGVTAWAIAHARRATREDAPTMQGHHPIAPEARRTEPPRVVRREPVLPRTRLVTVAFRDPGHPDPLRDFDPRFGYTYIWPFDESPRVGDWAIGEGRDGPTTVIVGHVGRSPGRTYSGPYKTLISQL